METTTTVLTTTTVALSDSVGGVMSAATSVIGTIVGNPILILFLAASVVGIGIKVFRKLKA